MKKIIIDNIPQVKCKRSAFICNHTYSDTRIIREKLKKLFYSEKES